MTSPPRVVLLRDARWPPVAGVCCWRGGVREAFTAAGATVVEVTWRPPAGGHSAGAAASPAAARANPTPRYWRRTRLHRRVLGAARRGLRATLRAAGAVPPRLAAALPARRSGQPGQPDLGGADLVVAESLPAALAAVAGGVPRRRVWALALPAEWLAAGAADGFAAELAAAAARVGGLLTDSEPARESVERATAGARPRVEIFPPVARDRSCSSCAGAPAGPPGDGAGDGAGGDLPAVVAQLALWRALREAPQGRAAAAGRYPYAVARWRGLDAAWPAQPWPPHLLPSWGEAPPDPAGDPPGGEVAAGWTAAAQHRTARTVLAAVIPQAPHPPRPPRAVLVAGFDLKFAADLAEQLQRRTDLDVTVDDWPDLGYGTAHTRARLRRADAVFAEWARTSAIWYARHKRPDQFLAVRLHRFELDSRYPSEIAIDNVDAVVYIAPLFGRRIRDELGWPARKLVYIPNFLDVDWLDRPKLPQARFTIGFVGVEWARKRFDLALDLLAALRREDRRYTLLVRSVLPWHNEFAWAQPAEREYVGRWVTRIERDPLLRHAVIFDPPGRDMARWYRRVGHILSTSDEEGCHTAVGEGMASGAVPIVRPWPGAAEIYDKEWIHASTGDAVAAVLRDADADQWAARAARARIEIRRTQDPAAVVAAWADLLHGDLDRARGHFVEHAVP